jgi:hypothetical protein
MIRNLSAHERKKGTDHRASLIFIHLLVLGAEMGNSSSVSRAGKCFITLLNAVETRGSIQEGRTPCDGLASRAQEDTAKQNS